MKASASMRIWFAFVSCILWLGIYFTGFLQVNWLLYVPAAGFIFGAVTGICPSHIFISKILGAKNNAVTNK
jgi:hypothetical protein